MRSLRSVPRARRSDTDAQETAELDPLPDPLVAMPEPAVELAGGYGAEDLSLGDAGAPSPLGRRIGVHRRALIEWAVIVLCGVAAAVGVRAFAFTVFSVPTSSMVPTIKPGDRIVVDKLFFSPHGLKAGTVVVFHRPRADAKGVCAGTPPPYLVKRIVALPGQTISSRGNTIYINGRPQAEPYLPSGTKLGKAISPPVHVAKNHYFVLGDNRSISCDSRYWGTIASSSIVGRVVAVVWRGGHPDLRLF